MHAMPVQGYIQHCGNNSSFYLVLQWLVLLSQRKAEWIGPVVKPRLGLRNCDSRVAAFSVGYIYEILKGRTGHR